VEIGGEPSHVDDVSLGICDTAAAAAGGGGVVVPW